VRPDLSKVYVDKIAGKEGDAADSRSKRKERVTVMVYVAIYQAERDESREPVMKVVYHCPNKIS